MPITIASIMNLMGPDMMVILLIVLLLFGAKKLPELARGMGRAVKEFSAARDEIEKGVKSVRSQRRSAVQITGHKKRATVCAVVLAASTRFSTASHRQLSYRKNSMIARVTRRPRKKRIVILGGGFGGVYAAMHLEKLLAREHAVEICLVSRDNFFLFTPMLHEIAASDLEITNIVNPLRKLLHKVEVLVGDVNEIDLPNKRVLISRGYRNHSQQVDYDHLVIALGSITNFYNLPGFPELALAMKSLPDAIRLRAQILRHLEEANSECNPTDRQSLLTFVVAGGGFAGVETVAALNDFVREALPFYPNLCEDMLRVMLVHSGSVILPELGESLGRYTQEGARATRRGNST